MNEVDAIAVFRFRPWVRRAGWSIVLVAAAATTALAAYLILARSRWSVGDEPAVWLYLAVLWAGGLKIVAGTRRPVAEIDDRQIVIRPLHQFRARTIPWEHLLGTEQMTGGDRLIIYFETPRGMRFVAVNLNLVKSRREFLALLDERLRSLGFREKEEGRSRYLTRPG